MPRIEHIPLSELEKIIQSLHLPKDTKVTLTIEDNDVTQKAVKRQKALEAMRKLRGSGNGNLVDILLQEREKDKLQ
ncbi:MAG: hypothetical protein ACE5HS_02710 [bacterium]